MGGSPFLNLKCGATFSFVFVFTFPLEFFQLLDSSFELAHNGFYNIEG